MKKKNYFLTALLILSFNLAEAKIWRVNNNPGVNANFTNPQPAHDAAAAGDTIMLESSLTAYGNLTLTKKLVVLGLGYFLTENTDKQATTINARIGNLSFEDTFNGSGNLTSTSAGSTVSGLEVTGSLITHVSNLTISRCKTNGIIVGEGTGPSAFSVSNIVISQNYITGGGTSGPGVSVNSPNTAVTITNVLIKNNIIFGTVGVSESSSAIVENNTFLMGNSASATLVNSTYRNNIIIANTGVTQMIFAGRNSIISNNVSNLTFANGPSSVGHTYSNNVTNANHLNIFVTDPLPVNPPAGFTSDNRYVLKAGSPAIGAGLGGVNAGAFGNITPYILSGIPAIPTIYLFEAPSSGQNTLNVKISVKSNQ